MPSTCRLVLYKEDCLLNSGGVIRVGKEDVCVEELDVIQCRAT